ncbi:hypothetical protein GF337_03615 [candidate division KSB1 bacterium]|nr:hypothetical protein [candidate division KSB1 bacterium]
MTLFKISTIYGAWDVDVEKEIVTSETTKLPLDTPESPHDGNGRSGESVDIDNRFDDESHEN